MCRNEPEGAILVFMTGWDDISKLHEQLQKGPMTGDPRLCRLLPLHGSMPTANQQAIFARPPKGVRKVIDRMRCDVLCCAPEPRYLLSASVCTTVSISQAEMCCCCVMPPWESNQVVLATNIAETSITIDDIVYVVNGCKVCPAQLTFACDCSCPLEYIP